MTAADTLLETQAPEQLTQIVKPDGSVGGTTEKPSERFLSAHNSIVRVAYVVWLVCRWPAVSIPSVSAPDPQRTRGSQCHPKSPLYFSEPRKFW